MSSTTDDHFRPLFARFANLTSEPNFRRVSALKQSTTSPGTEAHYLLLQEFENLEQNWVDWRAIKKCEAEYWWRKHGFKGVLVEFFRRHGIVSG